MNYWKKMNIIKSSLGLGILMLALVCGSISTIAAEVTARLSSPSIRVGEATNLIITTVYERSTNQPTLPTVKDLMSTPMGTEESYSSVNGVVSKSRNYTFVLFSQKPGRYTLPPFQVVVDGETFSTDPMTITVTEKKQAVQQQKKTNEFDVASHAAMGVKYFVPVDKGVYVGQVIPVQINILFDDDSTEIATLPRLLTDAFTITELSSKPKSSRKYQGRRLITTYSWVAGITPVKAGEFDLSLVSEARISVADPSARRRRTPFSSFFGSPVRTVEANVSSKEKKVTVLPLPDDGKPTDFSGAIGEFTLESSISVNSANIGDPVTLKTIIDGKGNFSRVAEPILGATDGWKLYPSSENFSGQDTINYQGRKVFEQALIPLDKNITSVPPLTFSYFDTAKKKYVTLKTETHSISIGKGSVNGSNVVRFTERDEDAADDDKPILPMIDADGLAPIKLEYSSSQSLVPFVRKPYFPYTCIGLGVWFVFSILLRRFFEKYSANEGRRNRKSFEYEIKQLTKQVKRNGISGNVDDCVGGAVEVIKKCVSAHCSCVEESVSMHEIQQVFGSGSAAGDLFMAAESSRYSGGSVIVPDVGDLTDRFNNEVTELLEKL